MFCKFPQYKVKETVNQTTNQYGKLANISYDKQDGIFRNDNPAYDPDNDVLRLCCKAEELFELYQRCANRKQIETICTGCLRSVEAAKQSGNGHLYFVPRTFMAKVDAFERFITLQNEQNQNDAVLTVNSFYVIDDAKQWEKMTEAYRSGHYQRNLTTTSGDVTLNVPRLKGVTFETAIIERYRRRESSVGPSE